MRSVAHVQIRARVLCQALLLAACLTLLSHSQALSATPAPAWSIVGTNFPSSFIAGASGSYESGPAYYLLATNVGAAPTSGTYTLTDVLPPGVTLAAEGVEARRYRLPATKMSCNGTQTVTCTGSQAIDPGEVVQIIIPVDVDPGVPASLTNEATIGGGGAGPTSTEMQTAVSSALPSFTIDHLRSTATEADGTAASQAGSHPHMLLDDLDFPTFNDGPLIRTSGGGVKDIEVDLPPGAVVNPTATPVLCTELQLQEGLFSDERGCPPESQVGTLTVAVDINRPNFFVRPLFNMVPPPGSAAEFGAHITFGVFVHLSGDVRSRAQDYRPYATADDTLAKVPIYGAHANLWGDPSGSSHDFQRRGCLGTVGDCPQSIEPFEKPFLTMPSACSGPLETAFRASSWLDPGTFDEGSALSEDVHGNPVGVNGCSALKFEPTLTLRPDVSQAETPTGVEVNLHIPQNEGLDELATANLKDTEVTLPEGLVVNAAAASGLGACTSAQIEINSADPDDCPEASKVGTVEVNTPLLDHPVPGAVYLASPHENLFNSLLAIYLAIDDPKSGVVIKLPGKVEADPATGQLTTTFNENPQLPFEDFTLEFFGGPRASLKTPDSCGSFATKGELAPWSGTPAVQTTDSFNVTGGANGKPCINQEASRPNKPSFSAGTLNAQAGSYSPFVLRLSREDGDQKLKGLDLTLPPGLSGKLAGIEQCSEAAIASAASKSGKAELASPSCPSASKAGEVTVGAGAGTQPYYVKGNAYLAGPYKGAPLSMAIVTPAVAGPFDLGNVVVRAALHVDPKSAQITVKSDPFPTILQGIPLSLRDVRVEMNRPEFTLNPTNCDPMAIQGEATSLLGQLAALSNPFQAAGCRSLDLKPRLALQLKGATARGGHPSLTATLTPRPGDANIERAAVTLPRSEFLDQAHIRTVCTRVQFAADACPDGSIYGRARAKSPLLDEALDGPVYLRSSDNKLPDLVAVLAGPPSRPIEIELVGRIDSVRGGIRNTFEAAPDVPVSRFVLSMQGGRKGLLVNSRNICAKIFRADVKLDGHNGAAYDFRPAVRNGRCAKARQARRGHDSSRR